MNGREQKERLRDFSAALDVVYDLYPRMELGQLKVFLHILLNPGIRAPEILDQIEGTTRSGIYKTLKALSAPKGVEEEGRKRGLWLVEEQPDPTDGRSFQLMASWKGQMIAEQMAAAMKRKKRHGETEGDEMGS